MCGIIGYLGDEEAGPIVYQGLENLEYRGYDSAGVALVDGGMTVAKRAGEVADLEVPSVPEATCGIGHTRWSTHGPPTDANAHPHTDCSGEIAVVHNGIIENHEALKRELADHEFTSQTDTEVIPHLLEEHLDGGVSLREAMEEVTDRLEGNFAICAVHGETEEIVATRNRSPLVLGHGDRSSFVASDIPAFLEHTKSVTYLEDGQLARLTNPGIEIYEDGEPVEYEVETIDWDAEAAQKGGYRHFMRKEIHEQPQALRKTIAGRLDHTAGDVDLEVDFPDGYLDSLDEIQLVAAGTSYYAATYGAWLFNRLADVRANAYIASEYDALGGRDPWRTLAIAVTQSGETADTLGAIRSASGSGMHTLGVTNYLGSSVTRETDDSLFIKAGPEIGVAATKTFASQVMTLAMLAVYLGRERDALSAARAREVLKDLAGVPAAVQQVLDREDEIEAVADSYLGKAAFFFVGRHLGHPVALEGALKLKEIAYVHAEAFAAGELKHGPLALVTEETPVLAVLTEGAKPDGTIHNVAEAQARGAPSVGVVSGDLDGDQLDHAFPVPDLGLAEPLVANVYFQLFAYHVADAMDRPIDKPRNLAKSVTVE